MLNIQGEEYEIKMIKSIEKVKEVATKFCEKHLEKFNLNVNIIDSHCVDPISQQLKKVILKS